MMFALGLDHCRGGHRRLEGLPMGWPLGPVAGNPVFHFAVQGAGGGDVGDRATGIRGELFGIAALAAPGPAGDENDTPHVVTLPQNCPAVEGHGSSRWSRSVQKEKERPTNGGSVLIHEDPRPGECLAHPLEAASQLRDSTGFAPASSK